MRFFLSGLKAPLNDAAPADCLPVVTTPVGGLGTEDLSLAEQGASPGTEKMLARYVKRIETGLESATKNLIHQASIMTTNDKVIIGLESRLNMVQDQLGDIPKGQSVEFEAPTLNGRFAVLADRFQSLRAADFSTFEVAFLPKRHESLRVVEIISETQVIAWVNDWWTNSDMETKIAKADLFADECGFFLPSLVSNVMAQGKKVQKLTAANASRIGSREYSSASAKTASTNYGELKKKVDSHEKKLQK
jgi:hypothetical protein